MTLSSGITVLFSPRSLASYRHFYFHDLGILAILSVFVVSPNQTQVSPQILRGNPPLFQANMNCQEHFHTETTTSPSITR